LIGGVPTARIGLPVAVTGPAWGEIGAVQIEVDIIRVIVIRLITIASTVALAGILGFVACIHIVLAPCNDQTAQNGKSNFHTHYDKKKSSERNPPFLTQSRLISTVWLW
jgi:hypothetical protein